MNTLWFVLLLCQQRETLTICFKIPTVKSNSSLPHGSSASLNFLTNNSSLLYNPYPPESISNLTLIDIKSSAFYLTKMSSPLTWYWYVLISEDTLTIVKPLALGLWIPSHEALERHSGSFSYNLNLLGRPDPGWFWNSNTDFNISCEPWVELQIISVFFYVIFTTTVSIF